MFKKSQGPQPQMMMRYQKTRSFDTLSTMAEAEGWAPDTFRRLACGKFRARQLALMPPKGSRGRIEAFLNPFYEGAAGTNEWEDIFDGA